MSALRCLLAVLPFLFIAPAAGEEVPGPELPPVRVVEIQLEALQHNDTPEKDAGIARTWTFAHPANKSVTGPLERFASMIKGPAYRMLVDHRSHAIERLMVTEDSALFAVTVVPASGPVVFYQWQLAKVQSGSLSGAWMTISVSPPLSRGNAI